MHQAKSLCHVPASVHSAAQTYSRVSSARATPNVSRAVDARKVRIQILFVFIKVPHYACCVLYFIFAKDFSVAKVTHIM